MKHLLKSGKNLIRKRNREYDSNGHYMYPYGVTWDLDG